MAEKRYVKGLFKDTGHIDQPDGTWRHARNMVLSQLDGSMGNEGGTELSGHLGGNNITGATKDKVIGAVEVSGDKTILFITDTVTPYDPPVTAPRSEIGIWEKGEYTLLFNPAILGASGQLTNDLNFRESNPIEGTFKIDSKGDLIIYWTDDLNPPRAFNVDRQLRESTAVSQLYGISPMSLDNINILNLFPYSGPVPHIYGGNEWWIPYPTQDIVKEGGGLRTGVYYLALAYVDDDLVATNFLTVSNPVSIVDDYDHTTPTTKKDGARAGDQTSKSLKWRITNLNEDYKYIRPVVIRKMGDATDAYKMNDLEINLNTAPTPFQEITFSGIEGFSTASVEEVIIDTIGYDTAKTIQQLDNILYLGNTTRTTDLGYQKYANNIKSRSIVRVMDPFDEIWATADGLQTGFGNSVVNEGNTVDASKSYRYIPNILNYRGYMRDEVYAFSLVFIMNDGSMSYAYHIPGREEITSNYTNYDINVSNQSERFEVPSTTSASRALKKLSVDAKLFHFYDKSWVNTGANSHSSGSRHMQFWENSTEIYPTSDNFDVWDKDTYIDNAGIIQNLVGSIKSSPVRHHKMPSNANSNRTTIDDGLDTVITHSVTDPTPVIPGMYTGSFRVGLHTGTYGYQCISDAEGNGFLFSSFGSSGTMDLDVQVSDTPTNGVSAWSTVYSGNTFTAQEDNTTVTVTVHLQGFNDHACNSHTMNIQSRVIGGATSPTWSESLGSARCGGCATASSGSSYALDPDKTVNGSWSVSLNQGDQMDIRGFGYQKNNGSKVVTPLCHNKKQWMGNGGGFGYYTTDSWVQYTVTLNNNEDYHDANIKHKVNVLGMQFDDIQIPASYKDKIQGFRVYRAKRSYSNRTILGQGPVIPMKPSMGTLGMCQESLAPGAEKYGSQVLQSEGLEPESFWACTSWKGTGSDYPSISGQSDQYNVNEQAYKNLQFYDFNLLRNKYSLSPATHIQAQYRTHDLVWNGPEINQPKKMITVLSGGSSTSPYKVREVWGWDNDGSSDSIGKFQNCYKRGVNSAMFVGAKYNRAYSVFGSMGTWGINRVLGQKAKSYIQGDSIFKAASLGFGGKVVNLGGNSSIILGLANKLELPALWSRELIGNPVEQFGVWMPGMGFNLVTRDDDQIMGTGTGVNTAPRHQNYIVNLNAFKTDVYKNIDNQELVWTGYEILGDDLDNFLFDDGSGTIINGQPDFSTENITPLGADTSGVFGGDTFISRYGVAEAYSPSDDQTDSDPSAAIYSYIVENSDNIAFRHAESDDSLYYPGSVARDVLTASGRNSDLNHIDNLKYNDNYSADNDIRPAFPLPLRDVLQSDFPTRTHRSAKHDTTSIIDNYRIFLANQFKDLPKNRGDLWKLSSFNNLLYFHMEESLYAAQGKQSMQMKDGSEAFVGSGDIFQQDPNELVQTEGGFGGTQSQYASLTTRYGYFFVDRLSRKIFMMKDSLLEISNIGMETWFTENLTFTLEKYGFTGGCNIDNPIKGMGFHAIYDPKFKRILLTKREFTPTEYFIDSWNANAFSGPCTGYPNGKIRFSTTKCLYQQYGVKKDGSCGWTDIPMSCKGLGKTYFNCSGWTISYYPELGVWGGFHDYVPYIYFNTSTEFYSLTDQYTTPAWVSGTPASSHVGTTFGNAGIWKHNSKNVHGILYQENEASQYTNADWLTTINYHPFEFEFIHNEYKAADVLLSAFNYTSEVFNQDNISVLEHGFTNYFIYNTLQMSGEYELEYLINTRRIGNNWKVNKFRDMAALATNTNSYYMSTNPNVIGGVNTGTVTTSSTENMFDYNGMFKTINVNYLNLSKNWNLQRKFIDKWVGIRLIYDNISNNSVNLYATDVVVRKMHR